MRAHFAMLFFLGCGRLDVDAPAPMVEDASTTDESEVAFTEPHDGGPDQLLPPTGTCDSCPSSAPSIGSKCTDPVFCEYPFGQSSIGFSCASTCNGAKWIADHLADASPDADSLCPDARPLMGSKCNAGSHECALGARFEFYDVSRLVYADTYSCRCGHWQLNVHFQFIGAPPPC